MIDLNAASSSTSVDEMIDLNTDLEIGFAHENDEDDTNIQNTDHDIHVTPDDYINALETKLQKVVVADEEEAYKVYCEYAHFKGFDVRKGRHDYYPGTSTMRAKLFTCSKEGYKNLEKRGNCSSRKKNGSFLKKKKKKSNERTGCDAKIWFTRTSDGSFKVTKWVRDHNHELAKPKQRHLLKTSRSISEVAGNLIKAHLNAGIRPIDSFRMVAEDSGGVAAVGFTKRDLYNYAHLLKASKIEAGDSQSVINHFKNKSDEDRLFYWDMQLDDEGRMKNIFWRDAQAKIDYEVFGDVVTFDTTYRTNKYGLICAPFVGVNHHFQNVMFGCGFLSDESIPSFKWLFETFKKSMEGKEPKTIFTDQDPAMLNAIPNVFLDSRHRLCQWHISQNAPSHLGSLQRQPGFMDLWYKCMKGCDSETEFEATWTYMKGKYLAREHSWLNRMYELRHKWSTAFHKDTFYADLKSTSRSESTNHALNGIADRTTCLNAFVEKFEKLVGEWRDNEGDADHFSNQGVPTLSIQSSPILKQASLKYTHTMYKMFEDGFMDGVGASDLKGETQCSPYVSCYEVELKKDQKVSYVTFDVSSMEVKCTCGGFETMGLLCPHAFRVFASKNIHAIPEIYFLKRWCRDARDRVTYSSESQSRHSVSSEGDMVYVNRSMSIFHEFVMQSKSHLELRLFVDKTMKDVGAYIKAFLQGQNKAFVASNEDFIVNEVQGDENNTQVRDPQFVRSKGAPKKIPRHWDKNQKRQETISKGTNKRRKKNANSSTPVFHDITNVMPMTSQECGFMHMQRDVMNCEIQPNLALDGLLRGMQPTSANNPSLWSL